MTACFDYPQAAFFGRPVPKHKIYGHMGATAALKERFVAQVDEIVWRYKLAPETINLAATVAVMEIQVFGIALRSAEPDDAVLQAIDRAIPLPLIFELTFEGRRKAIAAFKRPSEADGAKWVTSPYVGTDWEPEGAPRLPLPVALNLGALYEQILGAMTALPTQPGEGIEAHILRLEAIRVKTREVERIEARMAREQQFNKRVAINAELRVARLELERLSGTKIDKAGVGE
jgi:hypothetical protein